MEALNPDDVFYIIVHCSATKVTSDYTPEQMRADHLKRGFEDIGYHYYIRKDGTVTQHRLLSEVGAHCKPWNRYSLGVCYEGGLDAEGSPSSGRRLRWGACLIIPLAHSPVRRHDCW